MDVYMPGCNGIVATSLIKAEMPEVKIVMLTASEEDDNLFDTIKNGACGYSAQETSGQGTAGDA